MRRPGRPPRRNLDLGFKECEDMQDEASGSSGADAGNVEVRPGFCRVCLGFCGVLATIVEGRVTKIEGDRTSPITGGFTCAKGRAIPRQLSHPDRLLHATRRGSDGSFERLPAETAMQEVALRLRDIVAEHGPRSVAVYLGTGSAGYSTGMATGVALWREIQSPMVFSPGSIDQPGKQVAGAIHGYWQGGSRNISDADVWMFMGANPIRTMWAGTSIYNPVKTLRDCRQRGMRIIVADPRHTELAKHADIYLPIRPGQDPVLLCGIIRLILQSSQFDAPFVARHTIGLEALRAAVEPFDLAMVAERTGLKSADIERTADLLAGSRKGGLSAGTGPNMAPNGLLTEYLLLCLQSLKGFWRRQGEPVPNPGMLSPPRRWLEQAQPPRAAFDFGEPMRVAGFRQSAAGMPTGLASDEMLLEGPGRVRALINLGGNPVLAWPNQAKVEAALRSLDLLVSCDVRMSATARLSHYVLGAKFHLEIPEITQNDSLREYGAMCEPFPIPFAMYSPPLSAVPEGSDLIEEWELFHRIAKAMGKPLSINGVSIAAEPAPTTEKILGAMLSRSTVTLDELKRHERGHVFPAKVEVGPPDPGFEGRLNIGDEPTLARLAAILAPRASGQPGQLLLVCRREGDMKNSWGTDLMDGRRRGGLRNPVWLNPADLAARALRPGQEVEVRSAHGSIRCQVEPDAAVRPGVVSICHGWGDPTDGLGENVNRLTDNREGIDPITAMPVFSALPVTVAPI
jgi:anaerobic selenocysteine-containing dehydrogenase